MTNLEEGAPQLNETASEFEVRDLTTHSLQEVRNILQSEIQNGYIIHGSNSKVVFSIVEVRQANDLDKKSGNQLAVYATNHIDTALCRALIDREYIKDKCKGSYTFGWRTDISGRLILQADPNVYKIFENHDPQVFTDGYIYVLDESRFSQADDDISKSEYFSLTDQVPIKAYKVSSSIADELFVIGRGKIDTIIEYSQKEMDSIRRVT